MTPALGIVGVFIVGIMVGFYFYRELSRFAARSRFSEGVCASCGEKAYVTECERCGLSFGMCHHYSVLGTDDSDPAKLKRRRGKTLCVVCLTVGERETLEGILKP